MKNNIVVMNLSGTYEKENFYKEANCKILNCREVTGTNCYCDNEGECVLKSKIKDFEPDGIHFIDSGNYHYITKFWTDKIKKNFDLIVFDHHTDMKESMFWSLLSCGSWVKEVLDNNKYIKKVILIGPAEKYTNQIEDKYEDRVIVIDDKEVGKRDIHHIADSLNIKEPVYISVDKDILSTKTIKTNWDQGDFSLKKLEEILKDFMEKEEIIGIDICGEPANEDGQADYILDDKVNKELMDLAIKECNKDIELVK